MTRERVVDLADISARPVSEVGGKAASLATMADLGLRVPPAFVITTTACVDHVGSGVGGRLVAADLDADLVTEIDAAVVRLETAAGRRLGDPVDPLLVSVRSGAAQSMPGMMDTVLDLGLTDTTTAALARAVDPAFAAACRARFVSSFTTIVANGPVPDDPRDQLLAAIAAVFASWDNERARTYRDLHGIPHDLGTAVVVQAMVFGNRGPSSGTGVVFSRDPNTGRPGLYGDYLADAQGEDVVGGDHATAPIAALHDTNPDAAAELAAAVRAIEAHHRDLVDVEFTIEDGTLFLLQARVGKRAAAAAVRIAVELVDEGTITVDEALPRVDADQLARATTATISPDAPAPVARGLGACPGIATGTVCLSSTRARDQADRDTDPMILVRRDTSPDDILGMMAAAGVLTARGGLVSHAALVARELDLPTVVGAETLVIDEAAGTVTTPSGVVRDGDVITIDGATGAVHVGAVPVVDAVETSFVERFRTWLAAVPAAATAAGQTESGASTAAPIPTVETDVAVVTQRVLHTLAIRGLADADPLAVATGCDPVVLASVVDALVAGGDAVRRDGRMAGYQLTEAGRARQTDSLATERADADLDRLATADATFLAVNGPFKELCTEWQTTPERDRSSFEARLPAIHRDALDAIDVAARGLGRFAVYRDRLQRALDRFLAGDDTALLRPLTDSYHDVWMELHHDLLLTLGRTRSATDGH